jgi:hypothetical protein
MLNYLKEQIKDFSENKFGKRKGIQAMGPLCHLKEEINELLDVLGKGEWEEEEEWADCLLLLLDAFRIRYGNTTSFNKLLHFALIKLEIIKKRTYDETPDANGVYHSKK